MAGQSSSDDFSLFGHLSRSSLPALWQKAAGGADFSFSTLQQDVGLYPTDQSDDAAPDQQHSTPSTKGSTAASHSPTMLYGRDQDSPALCGSSLSQSLSGMSTPLSLRYSASSKLHIASASHLHGLSTPSQQHSYPYSPATSSQLHSSSSTPQLYSSSTGSDRGSVERPPGVRGSAASSCSTAASGAVTAVAAAGAAGDTTPSSHGRRSPVFNSHAVEVPSEAEHLVPIASADGRRVSDSGVATTLAAGLHLSGVLSSLAEDGGVATSAHVLETLLGFQAEDHGDLLAALAMSGCTYVDLLAAYVHNTRVAAEDAAAALAEAEEERAAEVAGAAPPHGRTGPHVPCQHRHAYPSASAFPRNGPFQAPRFNGPPPAPSPYAPPRPGHSSAVMPPRPAAMMPSAPAFAPLPQGSGGGGGSGGGSAPPQHNAAAPPSLAADVSVQALLGLLLSQGWAHDDLAAGLLLVATTPALSPALSPAAVVPTHHLQHQPLQQQQQQQQPYPQQVPLHMQRHQPMQYHHHQAQQAYQQPPPPRPPPQHQQPGRWGSSGGGFQMPHHPPPHFAGMSLPLARDASSSSAPFVRRPHFSGTGPQQQQYGAGQHAQHLQRALSPAQAAALATVRRQEAEAMMRNIIQHGGCTPAPAPALRMPTAVVHAPLGASLGGSLSAALLPYAGRPFSQVASVTPPQQQQQQQRFHEGASGVPPFRGFPSRH